MSKKKDDAQEPEVDPRAPIEATWRGVTVWQCPFCPRDGQDKAEIEAHIAHFHPERSLSVTEAIAAEQAGVPVTQSPTDQWAAPEPADAPEEKG